jgi:hypothetical protein
MRLFTWAGAGVWAAAPDMTAGVANNMVAASKLTAVARSFIDFSRSEYGAQHRAKEGHGKESWCVDRA